jgi:predicted SAM-dependent methyltransferase
MLELGVGDNARKQDGYEYHAVDCVPTSETTAICRVGFEPLPYEDNYFDFVLGDQFLEHIPRQGPDGNPVIQCINECYRVAKPGAKLQFNVPKWNSQEMWQDPTHVNPVPPAFWVYFAELDPWNLKGSYGITAKLRLDETADGGWYHVFTLTVIK